jgi:hypothetical protein
MNGLKISKRMRSKTFQRVLDDIEKKPWFYRFKLKLKVEFYTFLIATKGKMKKLLKT